MAGFGHGGTIGEECWGRKTEIAEGVRTSKGGNVFMTVHQPTIVLPHSP